MPDTARLIEKFRDENNVDHNEGRRGVIALCAVARAIGYKDPQYYGQLSRLGSLGDLVLFFEDNSGAIDAVIDWIGKQNVPEWAAHVNGELNQPMTDEDS